MKKVILWLLLFSPAHVLADRLGSMGLNTDLLLSTQAVSTSSLLTLSSATVTYLQSSSATITYSNLNHTHTGSSISGLDISDDTNLAVTAPIVLTGDTVSIDKSSATLLGPSVDASEIAAGTLAASVVASSASVNAFYSSPNIRTRLGVGIGTDVQSYDADLDDLADGSLSGSKVGSGVPAANIATGSLGSQVLVSSFPQTAVTPGNYTNTNLTVDAQGRLTAASNGSAGSSGAGDNFGSHIATKTIDVSTFSIVRVSSFGWTNGVNQWTLYPSTISATYSDQSVTGTAQTNLAGVSFTLPAQSTWNVSGIYFVTTTTAGVRAALDIPTGAVFRIILDGSGSSAIAQRNDERIDTDVTLNTNAFSTYVNSNAKITFDGYISAGPTGGNFIFQFSNGPAGPGLAVILKLGTWIQLTRTQ